MPSRKEALDAVRTILAYIGDDPDREGLQRTPERVISAWEQDWGVGYLVDKPGITLFQNEGPNEGYDQMLFMRDLTFSSFCEHHMAPFSGVAHIAYIPARGVIVGLSKLARIVQHYAARLQVQERLTGEIAAFIVDKISPDCAVMMEASHSCMTSRGVRQPKSTTITTALRGAFKNDPNTQSEFLAQARAKV